MLVHVEQTSSVCAFCAANFEGFETKTQNVADVFLNKNLKNPFRYVLGLGPMGIWHDAFPCKRASR